MNKDKLQRAKLWKDLYTRSVKSRRAQQLGIDYPRKNFREKLETESINVLFVCSMNKWRSPTAEKLYSRYSLLYTRSGGTSSKARHPVSLNDIQWADVIIVMESKHKQRLFADYPRAMEYKDVHVLEIPDQYQYMDADLIEELEWAVDPILIDFLPDKSRRQKQ